MLEMLDKLMLMIILAPMTAGLTVGFLGKKIGKTFSHFLTILGVSIAFILSLMVLNSVFFQQNPDFRFDQNIYNWGISGSFNFHVGFLIDRLSAVMIALVSFVSLCVHIYSVGYMKNDPGYQRFFSYISMFTFAMLMLVSANNFLQLYFGWEGVGVVSYLLIGFWFKKETANFGSLKAFLVNRVGDFGFLLGIAAILDYTDTLDFTQVFLMAPDMPGHLVTLIGLLLFMGAMGKSAQMPLHIWLPESMEGPTPISALIHAATMVTAGVYLVARLSPLYEYSATALSFILIIGASTALLMGVLALVQTDIKRVIAYSTISQLGYMMAALGVSAYSAGIFHLVTHAFFKALLFLAAGSVILALHHEQDMRRMGGLKKYMPVTYFAFLIGALALSALPPFSGFFSKDLIIQAVQESHINGAAYAYFCVLISAFITPLYIFRAFILTFHGTEKFSDEKRRHLSESRWIILAPLILLAVPAVISGLVLSRTLIFDQHFGGFGSSIFVLPEHDSLQKLGFNTVLTMLQEALKNSYTVYLSVLGIFSAWFFYSAYPTLPAKISQKFLMIYKILLCKYGFDDLNEKIIMPGTRYLAAVFFNTGDIKIVDHFFVNGTGRLIERLSSLSRKLQSGYLYHYALLMIISLLVLLYWMILKQV